MIEFQIQTINRLTAENEALKSERDKLADRLVISEDYAKAEYLLREKAEAERDELRQYAESVQALLNGMRTAYQKLRTAAKLGMDALEKEVAAVALLGVIRCSPERHIMPREWLTEADKVIGYWDEVRSRQKRNDAITALRGALGGQDE